MKFSKSQQPKLHRFGKHDRTLFKTIVTYEVSVSEFLINLQISFYIYSIYFASYRHTSSLSFDYCIL